MFSALFKFFLVQVLVCIIVSGACSKQRPQAALLARCMGVLGIIALLLGAAAALPLGGKEEAVSFMGSPPVLALCIAANIAQMRERKNN